MKKIMMIILMMAAVLSLLPAQEDQLKDEDLREKIAQLEKEVDKIKRAEAEPQPEKNQTPTQKIQWGKTVALDIAAAKKF